MQKLHDEDQERERLRQAEQEAERQRLAAEAAAERQRLEDEHKVLYCARGHLQCENEHILLQKLQDAIDRDRQRLQDEEEARLVWSEFSTNIESTKVSPHT